LRVFRIAAILALSAAAFQTAPPAPPAQNTPPSDYQDAVYSGMISCSPSPDSEYCSNVADKFYTVMLDGKDYVLKPALTNEQMLAILGTAVLSGGRVILIVLHGNALKRVQPNTPVQMRFHGGGVDVRVLVQTKKGPRLYATHYNLAVSQIEPPPKKH
jgi:hypothetical protein